MTPDEVEDYRRETEARRWLELGYNTPALIANLRKRITAKRGEAAAERLIQDMRKEYGKQAGEANG